jgi:hypothetical protein
VDTLWSPWFIHHYSLGAPSTCHNGDLHAQDQIVLATSYGVGHGAIYISTRIDVECSYDSRMHVSWLTAP